MCRYFCPSCHAKRLAVWSLWLEKTLLAPVPHRQAVLTVPKRLRPHFLYNRYNRALLGELSRVAAPFRRAVLRLFVRRGLLGPEAAQSMLAWPRKLPRAVDRRE